MDMSKTPTVVSAAIYMRLTYPGTGEMEYRVCGSQHWAYIKHGGGYHRDAWPCCSEKCAANRRVCDIERERRAKVGPGGAQ